MHLALKTDGQTMDVHLGPTWFLQREGIELAKADAIEVTGSVIESRATTFLVARELKKGHEGREAAGRAGHSGLVGRPPALSPGRRSTAREPGTPAACRVGGGATDGSGRVS